MLVQNKKYYTSILYSSRTILSPQCQRTAKYTVGQSYKNETSRTMALFIAMASYANDSYYLVHMIVYLPQSASGGGGTYMERQSTSVQGTVPRIISCASPPLFVPGNERRGCLWPPIEWPARGGWRSRMNADVVQMRINRYRKRRVEPQTWPVN